MLKLKSENCLWLLQNWYKAFKAVNFNNKQEWLRQVSRAVHGWLVLVKDDSLSLLGMNFEVIIHQLLKD